MERKQGSSNRLPLALRGAKMEGMQGSYHVSPLGLAVKGDNMEYIQEKKV